jgi:predicted nucleic acid-binding protein
MMVLVDTTGWVDFFAGRDGPHVEALVRLLRDREDVCICGVILTEVLQGFRKQADYRRTKQMFEHLLYLPMSRGVFLRAADLYRGLRRRGVTIRTPVDCMIAAVAIEHGASLLHNDRDFRSLSRHSDLEVLPTP